MNDDDLLFAVGLRSSTPTRALDLPNDDSYHFALFAEDDWKALPKLTLNMGLRWETDTNLNNLSWYGNRNPIVESFYQGTRHRDFNNWGPRFGFNYAFTPGVQPARRIRDLLRPHHAGDHVAGKGVRRARAGAECDGRQCDDRSERRADFSEPGRHVQARGAAGPVQPFQRVYLYGSGAAGIDVINNRLRSPMVQQFNLGFEKEVGHGLLVKIDGVHNLGTRFIIGRPTGRCSTRIRRDRTK